MVAMASARRRSLRRHPGRLCLAGRPRDRPRALVQPAASRERRPARGRRAAESMSALLTGFPAVAVKRRRLLAAACAHCAALASGVAGAAPAPAAPWPLGRAAALPAARALHRRGRPVGAHGPRGERLRRSPFLIRDAGLREYLQGIACKLAGEHCPDVRVYPVRTPFFNASMAPNGMMQVWSGLLLRAENEAQLAAVLGHEIGHYLQRQPWIGCATPSPARRSAPSSPRSVWSAARPARRRWPRPSPSTATRSARPTAIGLTLMRDAGYDPREASKVWDNLRAEAAAAPGGGCRQRQPDVRDPPALRRSAAGRWPGWPRAPPAASSARPSTRPGWRRCASACSRTRSGAASSTSRWCCSTGWSSARRELAEPLYFRAEARRLRGRDSDLDEAIADLRQAVALGKPPAQVHRSLGYIHQKRGQAGRGERRVRPLHRAGARCPGRRPDPDLCSRRKVMTTLAFRGAAFLAGRDPRRLRRRHQGGQRRGADPGPPRRPGGRALEPVRARPGRQHADLDHEGITSTPCSSTSA